MNSYTEAGKKKKYHGTQSRKVKMPKGKKWGGRESNQGEFFVTKVWITHLDKVHSEKKSVIFLLSFWILSELSELSNVARLKWSFVPMDSHCFSLTDVREKVPV